MGTQNNNEIVLQGYFPKIPEFSHELFGIKFYKAIFQVNRLSEIKDELVIILSETSKEKVIQYQNNFLQVRGQIRSYNEICKPKNKLLLRVFAKDISIPSIIHEEPNNVKLNGYLCKDPNYRKTPFGREISDLLVAVNRAHNKTDYIPVIAWGDYAKVISDYNVGKEIQILGRLQSRTYQKILDSGESIEKIVFEVSSSEILVEGERITNEKKEMMYQ